MVTRFIMNGLRNVPAGSSRAWSGPSVHAGYAETPSHLVKPVHAFPRSN